MPSKRQVSARPADNPDPLSEPVDRLIGEVRCLREVLDEIREDLSWVTRNGLPIQPIEHVHIKRMARNVAADDWNARLEIDRVLLHPPSQLSGKDALNIERISDELRETVATLAQGQIEPVLKALDEVKTALVMAMQRDKATNNESSNSTPVTSLFSPDEPTPMQVRRGRLF